VGRRSDSGMLAEIFCAAQNREKYGLQKAQEIVLKAKHSDVEDELVKQF